MTFEDGESESVTLTFGPMKKLIENWKKESKKEDKEKGKGKKNDDGKETKGSAKKEVSVYYCKSLVLFQISIEFL